MSDDLSFSASPCPHGRPSWTTCPHCLGLNDFDRPDPPPQPQPIITEQQGQRIMAALTTWSSIVKQEKGEYPDWNYTNITKSCLLGRLIYEGKDPLPVPPPRFMSAPWYYLIENGRCHFWRRFGVSLYERDGEQHLVVGQDGEWKLIEVRDDGSIVAEYPRNGRWLIRPVGPDDEPVEGGRTIINPETNTRDGGSYPVYFDTIIERIA